MSSLHDLLRHPGLWRAREQGEASSRWPTVPTGYAALDRRLPGGGWPSQGLIEVLVERHGIGELSLLMPALAALSREDRGEGWLAWVAPPYQPYAPALAACGIDVRRVLLVRAGPAGWAMEQALRSGACSAVLGWAEVRDRHGLRRLQLAAAQSNCMAVLFRDLRESRLPSPAVLRIALAAGRGGLEARILKARGGCAANVSLGWIAAPPRSSAH